MMTATQVKPFDLCEILPEFFLERIKGFDQIIRVLFTQRMKMQSLDVLRQFLRELRSCDTKS